MSSHIGNRFLDEVIKQFQIENEWLLRGENQFSWTAHKLCQTISSMGPIDTNGYPYFHVTSEIPLIKNTQQDHEKILTLISTLNALAIGSSLSYDPDQGTIRSQLRIRFHEEIFDRRCLDFQSFSIIQLAMAEKIVDFLVEATGGILVGSNQVRDEPDETLGFLEAIFIPHGLKDSAFAVEKEMQQAAEWVNGSGGFSAGGDEGGVSLEFAFNKHETALARLHATEPHPELGSGLLSTIQFPGLFKNESWVFREVNALNQMEFMARQNCRVKKQCWPLTRHTQSLYVLHGFTALMEPILLKQC